MPRSHDTENEEDDFTRHPKGGDAMMESVNQACQMQQQQTAMMVQASVMKETLNSQKMVGELVGQLIDSSTEPVGKTPGVGNQIDVVA
jgi:hypothetical protein